MTRSELIEKISVQYPHLYLTDVERFVANITNTMKKALEDGRKIELRSFGVFGVKIKRAGNARNPMTGESVVLPERGGVFFKAGKELKQRINKV